MIEFEITVKDPYGIHARPAGVLVKRAQSLESDISITCKGKTADAKRLISVMTLGAKKDDVLCIRVSNEDSQRAQGDAKELIELFDEMGI